MKCNGKILVALCAVPLLMAVSSSASSYEEDEAVAEQLEKTCAWKVFMCCWSGHENANSDVCDLSGDAVYCHGFGWDEGDDVTTNIHPLVTYVKSLGLTKLDKFYDSVEEYPMCGCIDEMPVVDDAECSRFSVDEIGTCHKSLRQQYAHSNRMNKPNGEMDINLVNSCDR